MMNTNWCDSEKTDGTDRISSLPNDVLTHILSFLNTREVVQTCILSKRYIRPYPINGFDINLKSINGFSIEEESSWVWNLVVVKIVCEFIEIINGTREKILYARIYYFYDGRPLPVRRIVINTWASIPALNFDIEEFGLPEIIDDEMAVEFVNKFEMLVKNVLEKRETSCVNIFRLWLDSYIYWPCTQATVNCIGDVMKMEPRACSVKLCSHENLNLNTDGIFTCASLIYLQLCVFTVVDAFTAIEPNSVNLPCLKILNLDGVTMGDDSLKKLLLGCPVLEELVLENCYIGIIEICSNTLKKLVLRSCHDVMRLQISTPNLLYLYIFVWDMEEIMLLNMSSLVDASIYIPCWFDQDIYLTMGPKLIHNLSNVKSLRLKLVCPKGKVQKEDFSNCPAFNNLKHLELLVRSVFDAIDKRWGFYFFDLVLFFLHQSPELQEITLYGDALVTEFVEEEITEEWGDALVQREFLKTVRIVGFKNDNGFVNQFINKLLTHVKIIGDIVIDP